MSFLTRIRKKLHIAGEQFTVGANTYHGVFKILDTGTMRIYLDDAEVMAVERPGLVLIADVDASIAAGNTITRDGREYYVMKVATHRIGGVAMVKIAILA
jgi:hypothetical protein